MASDGARFMVLQMFVGGADKGFRALDVFVSWFVGGTAAAVGILIANIDTVSTFIPPYTLGTVLRRVVLAFACVMIAKFLGSLICARAGSLEAARDVIMLWREIGQSGPGGDDIELARKEALPLPMRLREKWLNGHTNNAQVIAKRVMYQLMAASFLSLLAACLIATALIELAAAL